MCENKSPGRGNEAASGENKQMTNLTALIRTARANRAAACAAKASVLASGSSSEGNVCVSVIPVQPRGMSSKWSERADVYMDGKRVKTAEVKAMLKAEAGQ